MPDNKDTEPIESKEHKGITEDVVLKLIEEIMKLQQTIGNFNVRIEDIKKRCDKLEEIERNCPFNNLALILKKVGAWACAGGVFGGGIIWLLSKLFGG